MDPWRLTPQQCPSIAQIASRESAARALPGRLSLPLVGGCEMLLDHVTIGLEPLAVLCQLAALDGPDLHPAAALVIFRRHLHRRHHAAERDALDRLSTVLHFLTGGLGAALGLDGIACGFGVDGRDHDTAVV